ncbi:MAG: AIR synthase-related protein [Lachnospiraceae bacterium]
MKIGKVSQTVLKRSVLGQLNTCYHSNFPPLRVEEMCGILEVDERRQVFFTDACCYGNEKNLGVFVIAKTINDLASRGAEPQGITVNIQLPPHAYESRLKSMTEQMACICEAHKLQVLSAKAEVNPVIKSAIVQVTAIGTAKPDQVWRSSNGKPEQDILLINWIGLEGMLRILNEKEEELGQRFASTFLQSMKRGINHLFAVEEIQCAQQLGASVIQQISGGGILAALWEMAEASHVGLEIDLNKIAIKQETIEVCECFQMNPYQLTSTGCALVFMDDGERFIHQMKERKKQAVWIGRTTKSKERVILKGADKRFIDRPQPDELAKIYM